MTPDDALAAVLDRFRRLAALEDAAGLLAWDQETMMPPRGAAQRAEARGALAAAIHDLRADPRLGEALDAAVPDSPLAAADLAEARRVHLRAAALPPDLAEALARETAAANTVWIEARAANDPRPFLPALARVLTLKREEAAALAAATGGTPYDALLDDFEPGAKAADLAPVLAELRAGVTDLLARHDPAGAPALAVEVPAEAQLALSRRIAAACGYALDAGRLDLSVHPFTSGGFEDVRITTRVTPSDPSECLYGTLHETGHALYEQGIPAALRGRPSGVFASMGLHESQSRFWENHVGRSRAAAPWLMAELERAFGPLGLTSPEGFFRAMNRVAPGFIRTAADELQYDLHILMRFDLERALLSGDLRPDDLPGAWDDRFEADFGRRPPDAAQGCLQDVHWSAGLIGYFPTYTLGNLAAAALAEAMRRDLPDLDAALGRGETAEALAWLRGHIHARARTAPAAEILADATGAAAGWDAAPLLRHLEAKFAA